MQSVPWRESPLKTTVTYSGNRFGKKNNIKIASFHDVHLGHRRTLSPDVIKGFKPILENEAEIASWDLLVFPGDLFDRLLFLTDPHLEEILLFLSQLIQRCAKHNVIIRILEGTPGHDHKQSILSFIVNRILGSVSTEVEANLKHVSDLSIEYIEELGITMLYVPDEWNTDVMETYDEVLKLMNARGLSQVDFCLLHGAFNYQIDATLNPKAHPEDLWCNLVKYYIFAGHVHFASQYQNILVAGSFDRLAHGEEQPKGWLTLEITDLDEHRILFHENKYATKYTTLDVRGKSTDDIIELIEFQCKDYPPRSHIRLHALPEDPINDGLKILKQRYSFFFFTIKKDDKQKQQKKRSLQMVTDKFEPIALNRDNIERIISSRVEQLQDIDKTQVMNVLLKYL